MTTPPPGRTVRALFSRMHCCQQSAWPVDRAVQCIIIGPIMHCTARSTGQADDRQQRIRENSARTVRPGGGVVRNSGRT